MWFDNFISAFPSSSPEFRILNGLADFFYSREWSAIILSLKAISFLVTAVLFGFIVYLYLKMGILSDQMKKIKTLVSDNPGRRSKLYTSQFQKIRQKLAKNIPEDDKEAVIKADSLLREALDNLGFQKETLKDLGSKKGLWRSVSLSSVIEAHEIRNRAVHFSEPLTHQQVVEAVDVFEKSLKDLGFL